MKAIHLVFALSALLLLSSAARSEETWKITSLEWPPFSGEKLPEGGSGIKALREALKSKGIALEVVYFPWSRAVATAANPSYAGFFPAWPEEVDAAPGFTKPSPLFHSPIVIAVNKAAPLPVNSLKDLAGKKIAVVQDYGNTVDFNAMVTAGEIKADVGLDDLTGLRKLAIKRVDGMLIDVNVMSFLLKTGLPDASDSIVASGPWMEDKSLVLAVNDKNPNAAAILAVMQAISADDRWQKVVDAANAQILGRPAE